MTVIFSSGSTGEPKGVLLTQSNIISNVEAVSQVLVLVPGDGILGILPLFHSFGCLSMWLTLLKSTHMVTHPNPLDASGIATIVEAHGLTILLATPTFLQLYARRCTPAQFGSLRLVIAGAEKLPSELAASYQENFGIHLLEGYGTTECSPVIAVSAPDFRGRGLYQKASKKGFVGQPLPGVLIKIVDPETWVLQPTNSPGMILVRGPNVMKGYLGRDDLTKEAIRDGWYVTGDIGLLDEEGFLKITDRLSRFSKIGGEMVPHGVVEEALQAASGSEEKLMVVTTVPDKKKGEKLAVVHTLDEDRIPDILEKLSNGDLPNLFIPKRDCFIKVAEIPRLGTGKTDLRGVKQIAIEALSASPAEKTAGR